MPSLAQHMWRPHFIAGLLNVLGFTPKEKKSARPHFTISCSHIKLILIIQHAEFLGLTDPSAKTKPAPAGRPIPAIHG